MLIGIDASRATVVRRTGTENYSLHLIRELLASGGAHQYRLYFNQAPPTDLVPGHAELRAIPFPRLWTHVRLSWEMANDQPDVLFVPSHVLPLIHPRRSVVTIHDLGYLYYPQAHTVTQNVYLRWSTRHNARAAARILADSQATRRDLVQHYGVEPDKVVVVYPGRDEALAPVTDPEPLAAVRARYHLSGSYFLYVGTLQPRKNLIRLVAAFAFLLGNMPSGVQPGVPDLQLVLAGQKGWLYDSLMSEVYRQGLQDRVVLPGYVSEVDLPALLSGALAFVFPSLYEGFGLPVLEAMACGTPVVCSAAASLPEVAGNAAFLVDPQDTEAWATALGRILTEEGLRRELVERGFRQIQTFSWQRSARETLQVLEDVGRGFG
jgi:glycosyltransferase involved in cell wall biosynthesis